MALTFDDDQAAELLQVLGLDADSAPDIIAATIKDAAQASTAADAQPSAVAAAARRVGLGVMDSNALAALQRDANEGRQIKAAAAREKIETVVNAAINRGAIAPSRKQHWLTLIEADPEMEKVLASTPDETSVPMSEIGHGISGDEPGGEERTGWFY